MLRSVYEDLTESPPAHLAVVVVAVSKSRAEVDVIDVIRLENSVILTAVHG